MESIEVRIQGGKVARINNPLEDWDLHLEWDNPDLQLLTCEARHFSGGLSDLQPINGLVDVQMQDPKRFEVRATITTDSTDRSGQGRKTYPLGPGDLLLRPVPRGR